MGHREVKQKNIVYKKKNEADEQRLADKRKPHNLRKRKRDRHRERMAAKVTVSKLVVPAFCESQLEFLQIISLGLTTWLSHRSNKQACI